MGGEGVVGGKRWWWGGGGGRGAWEMSLHVDDMVHIGRAYGVHLLNYVQQTRYTSTIYSPRPPKPPLPRPLILAIYRQGCAIRPLNSDIQSDMSSVTWAGALYTCQKIQVESARRHVSLADRPRTSPPLALRPRPTKYDCSSPSRLQRAIVLAYISIIGHL